MDELKAYMGLEITMLVVRINRLKDYWSSSSLLGNNFYKSTMSSCTSLHVWIENGLTDVWKLTSFMHVVR